MKLLQLMFFLSVFGISCQVRYFTELLICLCVVSHARDNYKQCRPKGDATKRGVFSESTLYQYDNWVYFSGFRHQILSGSLVRLE